MEKNEKKKKFLIVLPLLVVPFLTMAFLALRGQAPEQGERKKSAVFKTELPAVKLDKREISKLGYYNQAHSDSVKRAELLKNDPYYHPPIAGPASLPGYGPQGYGNGSGAYSGLYGGADPQAAQVYRKLDALNAAMNPVQQEPPTVGAVAGGSVATADVDRLERMMQMMQGGEGNSDPEMQQLGGMLESILDLQYPQRVAEKMKKASSERKGQVFSVSASSAEDPISVLGPERKAAGTGGFYSLDHAGADAVQENSVRAVVHETQVLVDGAVVKFRLMTDIYINGQRIPKDHFVFGIARLDGERLTVNIDYIRYGNSLFPVKLAVYDLDGLEGIHVPGAIGRDVAKQSGTNALQGISMTSLDPSLGAQAASAGIELSKSFLGKKVKQVKVTVKAGYTVLLMDENQKDQGN